MTKRSRHLWYRGAKTIAAGFFKKHGQMGAQAPMSSFFISLGFVAVLSFTALSWFWWWFPYHLFSDEVYDVVVVNAPQSFIDYNQYMQPGRDKRAAEYGSRTNWFVNWSHMTYFEYHYDGYGWTRFVYKENPAVYDFVTFGKWMRESDAYLTVVFPEDFEEAMRAHTKDHNAIKPDILTYYRTNSLEYTSMKTEFIDIYLHGYQDYLREVNGWAFSNVVDSRVIDDAMDFSGQDGSRNAMLDNLGRSFIPLLLFIVILYAAMSAGTNVIAGQKELGTFTGILLTPVPRSAIIAGNHTGVTLKTLIPAFISAIPFLAVPYYWNHANISAIAVHIIILTVFIAAVTLLISVINDTVVSAQTAFLPVFLILIGVCVTCIQNATEREQFYLYLPVYGQFYGLGDALTGNIDPLGIAVSSVATLLLTLIVILISERLLHNERYTVSIDPVTAKEIRQARSGKHSVLEIADKITDNITFIFKEMVYPLFILGFFQMIAVIPMAVSYMRRAEYSRFIADLKGVSTLKEMMNKTFEVIGIFMGNTVFLALMTAAYILMITACILHSKRVFKKSFKDSMQACGLPVSAPSKIAKDYILGFIAGFAMMSGVCLILKLTGQIDFSGIGLSTSALPVFFINLIMWFPQGASEELLFRGYMMPRFEQRYKMAFSVLFSSFMFSAFHSLNAGYTPLASVNLFLIAVLFALIFIRTGNIWMTCAMHTAWNLSQGNIYGLQVSGNEAHAAIINTSYSADAKSIITGGAFGPEGGLAVTAITAVCMIIVIISLARSRNLARNKDA